MDFISSSSENHKATGADHVEAIHEEQAGQAGQAGPDLDELVCPVCGARQASSKECRRCRADLSLVLSVSSELAAKRARCWALVRQRRLFRATGLAKECLDLSRDESSRRLLAVCYLLQGDFAAALRITN